MRILATGAALLLALASCSTTKPVSDSPYEQPNSIMAAEINRRVELIPFQHREELLENLLWLNQTGEQTIPALLQGMQHQDPKVRSSCAWVLGRLHDRRTVPALQLAMRDAEQGVRMEVARSLVLMGDLQWTPNLIEGLDSDRKEVRYLCHEALKTASGRDFGYDHLNQNQQDLKLSVLRWRQWWSDQSGDAYFAQSYQQQNNLAPQVAAPMGETQVAPGNNPDGATNVEPSTPDSKPANPEATSQPATNQEKGVEVPVLTPAPKG
ncbi:MAG: HEAT repeat domain-containing protein [Planctomycetes bacterium]|nr:HEAT repeat domain-containing protein [Planctomycetota bacterium]